MTNVARIAACLAMLGCIGVGFAATAAGPDSVSVETPWFRFITPQVPTGGYMTLRNSAATPAVLTAASSQACGMLMLHRSEASGATERMVMVDAVTIPAHGAVSFSPGGYHLMCTDAKMKPGDAVPVQLHFQDGTSVAATFPVLNATAKAPRGAK